MLLTEPLGATVFSLSSQAEESSTHPRMKNKAYHWRRDRHRTGHVVSVYDAHPGFTLVCEEIPTILTELEPGWRFEE
jgi:hypothetical protein